MRQAFGQDSFVGSNQFLVIANLLRTSLIDRVPGVSPRLVFIWDENSRIDGVARQDDADRDSGLVLIFAWRSSIFVVNWTTAMIYLHFQI